MSEKDKIVFSQVSRKDVEKRDDSPEGIAERLLQKQIIIHLYTDGVDEAFNLEEYLAFLRKTMGPNITIEHEGEIKSVIQSADDEKRQAWLKSFARASFAESVRSSFHTIPMSLEEIVKIEVDYLKSGEKNFYQWAQEHEAKQLKEARERRALQSTTTINHDLFDLSKLSQAYSEIIPDDEQKSTDEAKQATLVITGRGVANPEEGGYHLRAGLGRTGFAVVSTTGLIEAPSAPKEYSETLGDEFGLMTLKHKNFELYQKVKTVIDKLGGLSGANKKKALQQALADRMLSHGDERITQSTQGISLAMIMVALGEGQGAGFCSTTDVYDTEPDLSKNCRLHDAHRQEELINAQVTNPSFCEKHKKIFDLLQLGSQAIAQN